MSRRPLPSPAVEVALVAVHVSVALGFARLFTDATFLRPLLGYVLAAHLTAIGVRRARLPGAVAVATALAGGALATAWLLFPDTVAWGVPTGRTWTAVSSALDEARVAYPEVIAPTEALDGFLLVAGLALWTAAWFADWTAHRLGATVEAVAPAAAVFTFCAILGSGSHELVSAAGFAAAAMAFIGLQRAQALERDQAWSPDARPASRSMLRSAAGVGAVAIVAGALIGPSLPGASSESILDWRGDGGGTSSRVTISPMVELNKRLVEQSDVQVFSVRSTERAYWRLTSLDRFDGEIWASDGDFRPADAELPSSSPMVQEGASIVQEVEIDALSAIWVPVAFEATGLRRADQPLRWDEQSSTLIVESEQRSSDGLRYTAVSQAPTFDPAVLRRAGTTDPDDLAERYEALPSDFPAEVAAQARRLTDGQRTRYDQAIALQDWFREEFDYSLSSPPGHGDDALVAFLDSRVGYCEQFAGAYAAMARSLGIPARVAVGFTPGDPDPEDPQRSIVRGRHAHAWPELYFPGMGWVPFEPTPGRGIPGGETYTGVPEQQAGAGAESPTTSTTTEAEEAPEAPSTTAGSAASTPQRTETDAGAAPTADDPAGAPDRTWVLGLVAAVAAAAVGLAAWVRRRRRLAALAALRPADRAWDEVVRRLGTELGVVVGAAETPGEVASRVGAEHPRLADDLSALADLVTAGRWSEHPDEGIDGQAMAHRDAVVAALATGDRAPAPA